MASWAVSKGGAGVAGDGLGRQAVVKGKSLFTQSTPASSGAPMYLVKLVRCVFGASGTMCQCMLTIRLVRVPPGSSRCSCGALSTAAR